jgi:hypothetical protein
MTEEEVVFDQHLETHDAIQTVLDHITHRKDVEVYVSLIQDLEDLMVVIAKDMKGLQDGRKDKGHIQV